MDFPTPQQYGAMPVTQQQQGVNLPQYSDDPIATREKLTSDYFNNMGLIRSFAQDMSKKGINPFQPDYTQEGGGLAFQTMQKLQAGLMYAANSLGNELKAEQQMRPMIAQGQVRPEQGVNLNQGMAYSDPNNFYATGLDPMVTQANQVLGDATYTQSDATRMNQAVRDPRIEYFQQQIQKDPNNATYYQRQIDALLTNTPRTYGPSLIDRGRGPTQQDISGRAELIRKAKQGIVSGDVSALNLFKLAPGIEDVQYVNTGDKIGIEVWHKGQPQPSFVDLSKGGGEAEINALLNRVEGQKNIPNESVLTFDTKVNIPNSNARIVIDEVKEKVKKLDSSVVNELQGLAANRQLSTPNGEIVTSVEVHDPWIGTDKLKVKYHPIENNRVNYNKVREMLIEDKDEIDSFVETNANKIAPAFGGGFVTQQSTGLADQLTGRQQQAIAAFSKQFGREPSASEREKILAKYK